MLSVEREERERDGREREKKERRTVDRDGTRLYFAFILMG